MSHFDEAQRLVLQRVAARLAAAIRAGDEEMIEECRRLLPDGSVRPRRRPSRR